MSAILTWGLPDDTSPHGVDAVRYTFPFKLRLEQSGALSDVESGHAISVQISRTLETMWSHHVGGAGVIRVMFEYARRAAVQLLIADRLSDHYEVRLSSTDVPNPPPFDPNKIPDPDGYSEPIPVEAIREQITLIERENRRIGFHFPPLHMSKAEVLADIRRNIQEVSGRLPKQVRLSPSVHDYIIDKDDPQANIWGLPYSLDPTLSEGWVVDTAREPE